MHSNPIVFKRFIRWWQLHETSSIYSMVPSTHMVCDSPLRSSKFVLFHHHNNDKKLVAQSMTTKMSTEAKGPSTMIVKHLGETWFNPTNQFYHFWLVFVSGIFATNAMASLGNIHREFMWTWSWRKFFGTFVVSTNFLPFGRPNDWSWKKCDTSVRIVLF